MQVVVFVFSIFKGNDNDMSLLFTLCCRCDSSIHFKVILAINNFHANSEMSTQCLFLPEIFCPFKNILKFYYDNMKSNFVMWKLKGLWRLDISIPVVQSNNSLLTMQMGPHFISTCPEAKVINVSHHFQSFYATAIKHRGGLKLEMLDIKHQSTNQLELLLNKSLEIEYTM